MSLSPHMPTLSTSPSPSPSLSLHLPPWYPIFPMSFSPILTLSPLFTSPLTISHALSHIFVAPLHRASLSVSPSIQHCFCESLFLTQVEESGASCALFTAFNEQWVFGFSAFYLERGVWMIQMPKEQLFTLRVKCSSGSPPLPGSQSYSCPNTSHILMSCLPRNDMSPNTEIPAWRSRLWCCQQPTCCRLASLHFDWQNPW